MNNLWPDYSMLAAWIRVNPRFHQRKSAAPTF